MHRNKKDINFVKIESKYYPLDDNLRARIAKGHSQSCPMPNILIQTFYMPKSIADIEVSVSRGIYCWEECRINDCPAYKMYKKGEK